MCQSFSLANKTCKRLPVVIRDMSADSSTMSCFKVRSKADTGEPNLPHGAKKIKSEKENQKNGYA